MTENKCCETCQYYRWLTDTCKQHQQREGSPFETACDKYKEKTK